MVLELGEYPIFSKLLTCRTLEGIRLPNSDGRVIPDGILSDVSFGIKIPIYQGLVAFLVHGMGYARNEIHTVGIDWRKSINDLIEPVTDAIDQEFAATNPST